MMTAIEQPPRFTRDAALGITLFPPLTDRQLEVLRVIYNTVQATQSYPTQRQLAEGLACSQSSALGHINALIKKGYLVRDSETARRNLRLTTLAIERLEGDKQLDLNLPR